ncbi:indole-3-glycerol phosphate synthase TrpC [Desulfobacterium sp. N47]|uniref:Indole-3-glycerol phosphate synthase n=1 Tax=uncultured Desulfobacterium sp. TaxID=201089 RepID=E1YD93_9BACT|nr:Indole-3-glycerol phosphate synthase [uncultured Desulfobacterium sp.]
MDFLTKIVEHKKVEVEERKKLVPESRLKAQVKKAKHRVFMQSLSKPGPSGVNIIAEIKRASPSKGVLCPDLDPKKYAKEYEKGGAAAISVLTDSTFFMANQDDLKIVKNTSTLPILRKDFTISSYQIYETAAMGADAALLIVRILSLKQLKDYLSLCDELNLDALVEVNSEKELETASDAGARLIGINNRNLSSFDTDINTAMRLSSLLNSQQTAVAASGIAERKDIEKSLSFGIFNFLIGESLVKADNPAKLLTSLMTPLKDGVLVK